MNRLLAIASVTMLLSTLGLFPGTVQAQEELRLLDVEVIVFQRNDNAGHEEESWLNDPGFPPALESALELGSEEAREADIQSQSDSRLADVLERLRSDERFEVLTHQHYQLPEQERDAAPILRLRVDRRTRDDDGETQETAGDRQATFQDDHLGGPDETVADEREAEKARPDLARPLDGTLKVYRNRFFHAAADFIFNPELDERQATEEAAQERRQQLQDLLSGRGDFESLRSREQVEPFIGYRLNERRRIRRLGELHYLDHPRFGIIIRVGRPQ